MRRSRRLARRRRSGSGSGGGGDGGEKEQPATATPPSDTAAASAAPAPVPAALPEAAVWRVAAHVAAALEALHAARVIHMDVKPENVYLDWKEKEEEEQEEQEGDGDGGNGGGVPKAVVLRLGDFGLSIPAAAAAAGCCGEDRQGEEGQEAPPPPWEEGDGRYVAPELLSSGNSISSSPRPTPATG